MKRHVTVDDTENLKQGKWRGLVIGNQELLSLNPV